MVEEVKIGRGKGSSAKSKRTRQKIFKAAIRLFSKRGYRGTSIADIAKEAGVAKSAVFWYFESKDGLLEQVIQELITGGIDEMVRAVLSKECKDEVDMLNIFLAHFNEKLKTDPDLNRATFLLMTETAHEGEQTEKPFVQSLAAYKQFLNILAKNGQKKGLFTDSWNPEEISDLIAMLTFGAYTLWYRDPAVNLDLLYKTVRRTIRELLLVAPDKLPLLNESDKNPNS